MAKGERHLARKFVLTCKVCGDEFLGVSSRTPVCMKLACERQYETERQRKQWLRRKAKMEPASDTN